MTKKSSLALWRKIHIYSFGYLKWPSIFVSVIFVLISITGILYNHTHDFEFLKKGRVTTSILPDSYQQRLDQTRQAQGLADLFPEEAASVPVMWLVKDLHTGDFFGPWGRIFYDLVGASLIILAVTGCYLFLKLHPSARTKRKGDS
ncbi:MAG: PepSY domain-containing protein [Desulfobulbaceae bacterium]|nr:PepSY domain-containing protein [Desulfobulbaceae bacterium]